MLVYNDSFSQITFTPNHKLLHLKWLSAPGEQDLIRIYSKAIDLAKSTQAQSVLVDSSIGFNVTMAMQRSLASLAINQVQQVHVRKFARVAPADIFQEIITHKVLDQVNTLTKYPIDVAYFHNPDDAMAWSVMPVHEEYNQSELR